MTGPPRPDPDRSRAVLIGTHTCADVDLPPVPQIHANLGGLQDALCDRQVGFFLHENCEAVEQPSREDALEAVTRRGQEAQDTFLVYYGGHAVLDDRRGDSLLLSVAESSKPSWSFLRIDDLQQAIRDSDAKFRILVLDCCYSGAAATGHLGAAAESELLASQANMSGVYVLASSAANQRSLVAAGSTYTTFTGALINLLVTGIPDGHEHIEMHRLYQHLRLALAGPNPKPAQQSSGDAADLAIVRNRAYRPAAGRTGGSEAGYLSYFEEVVGAGLDLEARIDAVDTIARRAQTDDAFVRVLRMITETPKVPVLLRINVAWRLDLLGDEEGAANGLDVVVGDGGGAAALERLRALLTVGEPAEKWPELPAEDEESAARPVRLDRLNDERLWGRLMALVLLATEMPVDAVLDAVEELVSCQEADAARLILEGLSRAAALGPAGRAQVEQRLELLLHGR